MIKTPENHKFFTLASTLTAQHQTTQRPVPDFCSVLKLQVSSEQLKALCLSFSALLRR